MDKKLLLSDGRWTHSKKREKKKNEVFSPTGRDQLDITGHHLKMDVYIYIMCLHVQGCTGVIMPPVEVRSPKSILSLHHVGPINLRPPGLAIGSAIYLAL